MSDTTFLSVRWDESYGQYEAQLYKKSRLHDHKRLTGDESSELGSYLSYSEDWVNIPVAELIEQIESGDILFEEDSHLLAMLWEVTLEACPECDTPTSDQWGGLCHDCDNQL
jgi:hypothetical protein